MNRFYRRGLNAFAVVLVLSMIVVFALVLAKPSQIAAQTSPLGENVGDRYVIVAWNNLGMHYYDSDFSDFAVLPPYNTLLAQRICVNCHCDTCDVTTKYPIHPTGGVKTNILTLYDFFHQGQYAPLLMIQRPVICADCHTSAALGKSRVSRYAE